jgi:single-strand DNA-binding protein
MYHTLVFVGRLGQDSEMRYLADGKAVTSFSVATDRSYKNADGNQVKITTWFRVSVFGRQAESCNQYLNKGSMVLIEGTLNPDKKTGAPRVWTSQSGTTGASYEVIAQTVRFLSTKQERESGRSETIDESDIPF